MMSVNANHQNLTSNISSVSLLSSNQAVNNNVNTTNTPSNTTASSLANPASSNSTTVASTANTNQSSTNNTIKQVFNNSALKLIQRLLDEASQTGDLLLNNKNLNEFPSKIASNYDLSDTITAG